jgi:two-component system sensor histidine kinase AlgZ
MHALVPTLLLQPLIENAVHHGIEPSAEAGEIAIRISRAGEYVNIVISNPWHGGEEGESGAAAAGSGSQIGLDNVRQRLALTHDLEARLETSVRNSRFEVKIQLPMQGE